MLNGAGMAQSIIILNSAKIGLKRSNAMLNTLMVNAVNRGGLTALIAAINLVLLIVEPGTLYFYLPLLLSSKSPGSNHKLVYMNSILASLNSRETIRKRFMTVEDSSDLRSNGSGSNLLACRPIEENPDRTHDDSSQALQFGVWTEVHIDKSSDEDSGIDVNIVISHAPAPSGI
ncbi:hypothetical protein CVT24_002651 [Panaeolus cyanescens]|uniref:DUF6534 domain-containing protein n=1 Tax=Panaeolus cyanescens TaxID=181874 RepID=A0A409YY71_9AGAR|nr:hypothetical protein CVT24_002651 [Panaeolus cyanescens]